MKYSKEELAAWVKLDEMKKDIRNIFASQSNTDMVPGDDIEAIHKILFKRRKGIPFLR